MMKLTKSDIEKLKPLESYFLQVKEKYKRASALSEDMLASEYYEKLTNKKENNFACNQCVFKIYKTVGDAYWEALKEIETTDDTKTTTPKKNKTTTKTVKKNGQRRTKAKKD